MQLSNAQREIKTIGHHVHLTIIKLHVDLDTGIAFQKFRNQRSQMQQAERHGCGNTQQTSWFCLITSDFQFRIFNLTQRLRTTAI